MKLTKVLKQVLQRTLKNLPIAMNRVTSKLQPIHFVMRPVHIFFCNLIFNGLVNFIKHRIK